MSSKPVYTVTHFLQQGPPFNSAAHFGGLFFHTTSGTDSQISCGGSETWQQCCYRFSQDANLLPEPERTWVFQKEP